MSIISSLLCVTGGATKYTVGPVSDHAAQSHSLARPRIRVDNGRALRVRRVERDRYGICFSRPCPFLFANQNNYIEIAKG